MKNGLLLSLALCLVTACGGGSDPKAMAGEGSAALNSGKYAEAAGHFEAALAAMGSDSANPDWMRAKMGLVQALVHTDAPRAKTEFLALAASGKAGDREFSMIGTQLAEKGKLAEATEVLEAGLKAHAESPALLELRDRLGDIAKESGSSADLEALKGLGYVGD